jgi:tRNA 2-(methylsulfanyl)-N6-isopentenyladenosine37 hydroxylase
MAAATIRFLQAPSRSDWIDQALANLDVILLDHSHCERKAAGVAISLMSRYPANELLVRELTAIAQEELEHFAQVNRVLADRGVALEGLSPPPYGKLLSAAVRKGEPDRLLDSLLVAALIEARSHERLGLLADHCPDAQLAKLYRGLMASEARHYGAYWLLATAEFSREVVQGRLEELAAIEAAILAEPYGEVRIHS